MSLIAWVAAAMLAGHAAPPLAAARIAPADVDALVQVRGGLRGTDAGTRALAEGVCGVLEDLGSRESWRRAAEVAGTSPWALFERCAGRDASLLVRRGPEGPEWVLALEMPSREACELLRSVGGRMCGASRFELPQLGLEGAVAGDWLLVCDHADSRLVRDMLRVSSEPGQPTLADALPPGALQASDASLSLALRHGGGNAGHSVWRATAGAAGVQVEVLAQLQHDPLGELRDDVAVGDELVALPPETVACWVQPMPRNAVPASWGRLQPEWRIDEAVERTLGRRMIVAIGPRHDGEGGSALAVAYELQDAEAGTRAADAMLERIAGCCAQAKTSACEQLARRHGVPLEATRHWDAPAIVQRAFGGIGPLAGNELHARTVTLRRGAWRVYASDMQWLTQVGAALEEMPGHEVAARETGQPQRVGHAVGPALAQLVGEWFQPRASGNACGRPVQFVRTLLERSGEVSWSLSPAGPGLWRGEIRLLSPVPDAMDAVQLADRPGRP